VLSKKESKFEDYQEAYVYDTNKKHRLKVVLTNDLVGRLDEGECVKIIGLLRSSHSRRVKNKGIMFYYMLEASKIEKLG
jgi:DNA replicative helicase MCM subunit Mcm2 (Cdc46/Mcm family)